MIDDIAIGIAFLLVAVLGGLIGWLIREIDVRLEQLSDDLRRVPPPRRRGASSYFERP